MKGEIFNVFELFITENWGEDVYDEIFQASESQLMTQEPFVGPGTYPDEDFMVLLQAAIAKLEVPLEDAVRAFGSFAFPHLASKMEDHVESFNHPKAFLKTIHDVIHVEVRKMYPDAETPNFYYRDEGADTLTMIYQSKRRLYPLVEGLLEGVQKHFGVDIEVDFELGQHEGQEAGFYRLHFQG